MLVGLLSACQTAPEMPANASALPRQKSDGKLVAVLGPTNTGKTHLAIERMCGHSSGMIGFPLRLLAREVYDRVCAIKGGANVALITGEERIEPPHARWLLCTAEAMPLDRDMGFVALDEVQICADRERGHIFTDRFLHARGRDETMLLGSATMDPMVRAVLPEAEIVSRPRFSTLSHAGAKKLSRVPPRSAIVAFSAEQVYVMAELLRRFRGGAAVVMGAMSPQTRNAQVALYQSGEVDYLVATDAIGMGLNLDLDHVMFAGLSKFDGQRQRRLTTSEMAQIAGRAGRHHRDGQFGTLSGTLSGTGGHGAAFTAEEIYAVEEHRFAPVTRMFWRESAPRLDSLDTLIGDLSAGPERPEFAPAPEAIDLAVMRRLAEDPAIYGSVRGRSAVARFREACMLPDFRQHGAEVHARFVARLWEDLRRGALPSDYVAGRIADLDLPSGDIDTLQGRIAAIRSWAYIAQRPDWVLQREEMAARARAVEARLSDALHARLTERFVNRRLSVLMKGTGANAALLPVSVRGEEILVDGEAIGKLDGFKFKVEPTSDHENHKLLFAAAERHLPKMFAERAAALAADIANGTAKLMLTAGAISYGEEVLARLERGRSALSPLIKLERGLETIPPAERATLLHCLEGWLSRHMIVLRALSKLEMASREEWPGPELRALLIKLIESGGIIAREGSGVNDIERPLRTRLNRLGIVVGALDVFAPPVLRPAAQVLWQELALLRGDALRPVPDTMPTVIPDTRHLPLGYRRLCTQALRVDIAERLLSRAHETRVASGRLPFVMGEAMAVSIGITAASFTQLLRLAGFHKRPAQALRDGELGPPAPHCWLWLVKPNKPRLAPRTPSRSAQSAVPRATPQVSPPRQPNAFAALAGLITKGG